MPKWKATYESGRTYLPAWEKDFPWVSRAKDGSQQAFCKVCEKTLQPRKATIKLHAESRDHKSRISAISSTRANVFQTAGPSKQQGNLELKKAELQLAAAISCHSSVLSIDHFSEIVKNNSTGSKLENLHLHRTKCSMLITNVISPSLEEELCKEIIRAKKYCLLIDESTDVSSDKNLCICVRFYSDTVGKVVTALLGIVPVTETTGEALFKCTKGLLVKCGLAVEDCIGFSSDGASNMTGENNSLWSRLRSQSPNCIKIQCTCHSLALCIQKGFEKLPSNLGFMLQEIPKWFRKSSLRRENYKMLFETMNTGDERPGTPLPFLGLSLTRWLVRGKVIYNTLVNWMELKAYFHCATVQGSQDVRYKARIIWDMLNDDCNYLYFVFSSPVVTEFERVNSLFQSTDAKPSRLLYELDMHFKALHRRVYSEDGSLLPLNKVDFGAKFTMECNRLLTDKEGADRRLTVHQRCHDMLIELVAQVKMRLPENRGMFDSLSKLSPQSVLSQMHRPAFNSLPFPHLLADSLDTCEEQYRKILFHPWMNEDVFNEGIPDDPVQFWSSVKNYEEEGKRPYEELASYALSCLTTPVSNAVVERIFSHVNAVKTKVRNRMNLKLLESVLRIRTTLIMSGGCCKDLKITPSMLDKFSQNMYEHKREAKDSDAENLHALYD